MVNEMRSGSSDLGGPFFMVRFWYGVSLNGEPSHGSIAANGRCSMSCQKSNERFVGILLAVMAVVQGVCVRAVYSADTSGETFWERHRSIIDSVKVFAGIVVLTYLIKFAVWLIQQVVMYLSGVPGGKRISVKRTNTLLGFGGSIAKLFVWIFGLVAILNAFGVTPAAGAGVIGLIGLILAGMFQQIVIDFVKGLDIIAGRHYNVGDFIEVGGKLGHVLDFNAKYTRIRTVAGQEFNLPNSQCVPSRRFPDGYVNNYVDITLKTPADEQRAVKVIEAVCEDLNQRIEPVREAPTLVKRFNGPQGRLILRYRVRVLPGCGWVITDYFIPSIKETLGQEGIDQPVEPTFFFINRIETFRKLFSRQLTEQQIIREAEQEQAGAMGRDAKAD